MTNVLVRVAAVALFVAVNAAVFHLTSDRQLNWWGEQSQVLNYVLVTVLSLLGIFVGGLFRQIAPKPSPINIRAECAALFSTSAFWASLCVSPFIFGGVFLVMGRTPGEPSAFLLAFQNGFFCDRLISDFMKKQDQPGTSPTLVTPAVAAAPVTATARTDKP